jgi:hypothetical protein
VLSLPSEREQEEMTTSKIPLLLKKPTRLEAVSLSCEGGAEEEGEEEGGEGEEKNGLSMISNCE